jgi:hypothetical protein
VIYLFHKKRTWCVTPVASPEELAHKLTEQTWTLCTGFDIQGWIFLNDALSEDGAQEYGVVYRRDGKLIQAESVTFSWMTEAEALAFIQRLLAGEVQDQYGEVRVNLQTREIHGHCSYCE